MFELSTCAVDTALPSILLLHKVCEPDNASYIPVLVFSPISQQPRSPHHHQLPREAELLITKEGCRVAVHLNEDIDRQTLKLRPTERVSTRKLYLAMPSFCGVTFLIRTYMMKQEGETSVEDLDGVV